eukprot:230348-Amorphochlora_amoeboformis.AAC.1
MTTFQQYSIHPTQQNTHIRALALANLIGKLSVQRLNLGWGNIDTYATHICDKPNADNTLRTLFSVK